MRRLLPAALGLGLTLSSPLHAEDTENRNSFTREGLKVTFEATSPLSIADTIYGGDIVEVSLDIRDANSGDPVSGLYPAAWIDPVLGSTANSAQECRQKAGTYLSGYIGVRPLIDLNSYYLVVLNEDPSIAVIDPIIGVRGITKLLTQVILPGPASDWGRSVDEKTVFVSVANEDLLSIVDLDSFVLKKSVKVGDRPSRVAVQPDGQAVWVGTVGTSSGVSIVDVATHKMVKHIETGLGHHEIAFSADSAFAYVTNRDAKSVTIIDTAKLEIVKTVNMTGAPIAAAFSELADAAYLVDAETGDVLVIDGKTHATRKTIKVEQGLGPLKVTPDGRFALVVVPGKDSVFVIDTASNTVAHEVKIEGKPFQVSYSRNYAFIRALDTSRVSMIALDALEGSATPPILGFNAGDRPPSDAPKLLPSDLFASAVTESATLAVSPGDATVYYYMEGMNAPMGNFRNYGHRPLSAMVADRTIKEYEPGQYRARLKLPKDGHYQVIMTLDSPQLIECFQFSAEQNPDLVVDRGPARVTYTTRSGSIAETGKPFSVRFEVTDPHKEGAPLERDDIRAVVFRAPSDGRREISAKHKGDGTYEIEFEPEADGVYYIYPAIPGLGLKYADLPFVTIISRAAEG